jgi:hypothetical protein
MRIVASETSARSEGTDDHGELRRPEQRIAQSLSGPAVHAPVKREDEDSGATGCVAHGCWGLFTDEIV